MLKKRNVSEWLHTYLVFKFHFNNKNVPSLKVPLVIEDRKQARK